MLAPFVRSFFKPSFTPYVFPTINSFPQSYKFATFPIFTTQLNRYSTHTVSKKNVQESVEIETQYMEQLDAMIKNIKKNPTNEDLVVLLEEILPKKDIHIWNNLLSNIEFNTLINSWSFKTYLKKQDHALFLILENIYYIKDMLSV